MSDASPLHLAIDLGAGSGRAMLGGLTDTGLLLREAHRFQYGPRLADGHLRWDFAALLEGIRSGIRAAHALTASIGRPLASIGVDAWGVDYGLLDEAGCLIEDPVCYRDERTAGAMEDLFARVPQNEVFARTGIQCLRMNTLYQLAAHVRDGFPSHAARLLLIPDLCHHALCGSVVSERTNASTTQLLTVGGAEWEATLLEHVGIAPALMPAIVDAGTELGVLSPSAGALEGLPVRVIAPATHDTGSAVVGTPLAPGWAYISSGTWSLVGIERHAPLVNDRVAAANFTNEVGAYGTVRLLKNVMGLWILDACRREWSAAGIDADLPALTAGVEAVGGCGGVIFADDPRFFNPASMTREVQRALGETGQAPPDDPVVLAKVILDSLALRYASVVCMIEELTGDKVGGIHIVGGGALNGYLNQATADASGRCVVAGPVEATAAGNVVVQAIACGEVSSVSEARDFIAASATLRRFWPRESAVWANAMHRYEAMEEQARA